MRLTFIVCCSFFSLLWLPYRGSAHEAGEDPPTNIDLLLRIVRATADSVVGEVKFTEGERVRIVVPPDENAPIVSQGVYSVFLSRGLTISAQDSGSTAGRVDRCEFLPISLGVRYSPVFRDGLFGKALTVRTVEGIISVNVVRAGGEVGLARTFSGLLADTVAVDELPAIEHATMRAARGQPPQPGLWDMLLEPVIILGTLGIAVYLLFTVRS